MVKILQWETLQFEFSLPYLSSAYKLIFISMWYAYSVRNYLILKGWDTSLHYMHILGFCCINKHRCVSYVLLENYKRYAMAFKSYLPKNISVFSDLSHVYLLLSITFLSNLHLSFFFSLCNFSTQHYPMSDLVRRTISLDKWRKKAGHDRFSSPLTN